LRHAPMHLAAVRTACALPPWKSRRAVFHFIFSPICGGKGDGFARVA
jgi:hypothetical protein